MEIADDALASSHTLTLMFGKQRGISMESGHKTNKPQLLFTYFRRRRCPNKRLQAPTFLDSIVADLPASSSDTNWGEAPHFGNQKEGSVQELPSETLDNPNRHETGKRKYEAYSSDFEDYKPNSHACGGRRGSTHGHTSHRHGTRKKKAKDDSSDSETYNAQRPRVRGQIRNALHCSNSITQQGMLSTQTFQLYFEKIWGGISEEKRNSFAYLDSLWFSLYTRSYKEKVLNWIKKKDIFSKKYVLVPIVMWSHWSLLILCHFGRESKSRSPCMVLLDSLQSANQRLEPEIRKFVLDIHKTEEKPANRESVKKMPLLIPKVPQQRNGDDCGCYVLFYANLFLENAPESFSISDGYPYFMTEDWFSVESLDDFRQRQGSITVESSGFDE